MAEPQRNKNIFIHTNTYIYIIYIYVFICTFVCSFCCQSSCKLLTDCAVALGRNMIEPSIRMQNEKKRKLATVSLIPNEVGVVLMVDL